MKFQLKRPLVVFDIESTGVDAATDRIVEIGWVKVFPDGTEVQDVLRINPNMPIPKESSEIHGIYDSDIALSPKFEEVVDDIMAVFEGSDIGGFNSNHFDIPILAEECIRAGKQFDIQNKVIVDAFQIFVKNEKRDLKAALLFYCGKQIENAHSAIADVRATLDVIKAQSLKYIDFEGKVDKMHDKDKFENLIDFAQRFIKVDGVWTINFGKHKGKSMIEVHKTEPNYLNWMLQSSFPEHTKQKIREFLFLQKMGQKV